MLAKLSNLMKYNFTNHIPNTRKLIKLALLDPPIGPVLAQVPYVRHSVLYVAVPH